ncbi:SCO-spondin isoform X33 [Lingula anatina]|uniref:SCO-spondin isoform X33 n=1 Tax=Lingula anatina TaxID=7574 RepID=A0A2R2MM29_LINAN|nr:SCO-spondin isoform X33 [Lingula anatina]|eukprot:XP_023931254.1 SCO-spondin isoform X33 [Lingula anatina]
MHFSALRQTLALAVVAVVVQQTRGEAFHECKFWNNYIRDTTNKCQYYQCVPSTYTNGNWQFKATLMKCAYPTSVPEDYDDPRESAFDAVYTNPCSGTNFGSCEISGTGPEPRGWTQWGTWSACSVTCGSGSRSRVRSCPPGSNCAGASIEEDACNSGPCVVAPGKPTTFVNVLGTSMNVTWIPADSRATAYYVQYRQPGQFAWINSREEMFKNWILIPNLFLGAYEVRVVAKGVGGQETPSDTKTVQILGSVPGKPMATINVVGSSMNVSWIPADNLATSYYVEYRRTGDFNWQRSREERFNTWLWLQNLPQGIYEVRVVAKNAQGQETRSDIYPVEIKGAAPGKPTVYLQAVNNGFNVSWTAADNLASGFYAQYRRAGAFQWMSTREERRNSWIWVQNLGYGTYEVRVVARNNGGQETISDVSRVELKQAGPSAPVVYFNQQGNGVNVSWTADPMGTIYYVQYRRPGSFVWQRSEEEMFNNWIFLRNLQPGTYEMRVMVRGVNGQEVPSQVYTYEIQQQGPSAPMVYFTQQGNGVNVSWTADPMGTVYYVQYRRPGSFVWQKSQDVMTNNWIFLSNLQPGTYEMRVMVRGANGQEVPSQVYTYEIRQQGPSAPMVYFTQQGNGVNVSWTADPMGTVYYVQYRRPGSFVWQKSQEVMNNNYIFLSNLQPGTYEMRVMVRGANGQEVPSQVYTYEIQRQAPAKPTQVFVTKYGQSGMNISWFQPQGDGVLTYYIQYRRSGDVQWMSSPEERGRNWIIVQNLPMGVRYDTRVVVRNAAGQETYSDIYYMDMTSGGGDAPIKPTNVYITYTMSTMNVTWSYSPQQTNLVYYVQYRPVGTTNWVNSPQVMGDQRFIYISGLQPGTSYETRLVAMNMVTGAETASDPQRVDIMIGGVVDLREWNAWTACSAQCNGGTQFRYRDCFGVGCMGIQLREQRPCNTQACTSQTIGQWEAWTSCTAECGGGIRYRIRTCTGPCTAVQRFEIQTCNTQHCAGDVTYGQWNAWEACSVTCGVGRRERHRSCTGTGCALAETGQIQSCYFRECASMDLHEWGVWTTCTKPCDGGVQYRYRECFGMGCDKVPQREDKPCNTAPCVNVQAWGEWGVCSKECDGGFQTRARTCTGLGCDMVQKTEQRPCNTQSCMDLHDWGAWGMCSAQCNGGRQFRFRECYGTGCNSAKLQEEKPCNTQPCLDISQWGQWGTCSVTCGGGVKTRARQCFGVGCGGVLLTEQMPCNPNPCSTTSQWTQWGPCSVTCGAGEQARTRTCTGAACAGQPLRETRICQLQPCTDLTQWTAWGPCSVTCGDGRQFRTRSCTGPGCVGSSLTESRFCSMPQCRALSQWTQWGTCSVTCGDGTQKRMRTCTGAGCQGVSLEETRSCSQQACTTLSQWTQWGSCSVTCGDGLQFRTRTCTGNGCQGYNLEERRVCRQQACINLSQWSAWGTCSVTCGEGMEMRTRTCVGSNCANQQTQETRPCTRPACQVLGDWGQWTTCSATCGGGMQFRNRPCSGNACQFLRTRESRSCNTDQCVVQAQVSQWTQWGQCSAQCGTGQQERTRQCMAGDCTGMMLRESQNCNTQPCVQYGQWTQWGTCSVTCGSGVQRRTRTCSGLQCNLNPGALEETRACTLQDCVSVSLSEWGQWGACNAECDGGVQIRNRACFGNGCQGQRLQETRSCNQQPCVSLSQWGQWSVCPVTCNGGTQVRSRACFGSGCADVQLQESRPCGQEPCVSEPQVTEWGQWTQCTATCNGGIQFRSRACFGAACVGVQLQESQACNQQPCVSVTEWSNWGQCSAECDGGLQVRQRTCTGGAVNCQNVQLQESRACNSQPCVTLTQWSEWGTCSVTCGQGLQFRNRQCTGSRCAAVIKQESRPCTLQQCPSTNTGPVKPSVFVSPLSTGQGVNVTWVPQTPNMGYTYVLQYRTPGAFSWTSGGMETFRGWMVVPNLPLGTYEMRVIVTAPNGQETVSDIIRAEVANQGPVLPNLIFSQSPTGLNVSWVPTDSGHNHIVQYKRSTEFTWTTAGEERFRNYLIIPNLTPGSYEFRVIVRNNLGVETVTDVYRVEVRETSGGQTGPALPNFNIQQTTTGTGLNISWVPVPGLPRNTYIVQYRRPGELTWTSGGQESFNNFIIIPSLPTGTYEFRIIVRNNLGQETISQIFRVEVRQASGTTGPQMPNFNVASTGVGTGLNVSWVPIPGAFGNTYIAQFRQPGAPTWTVGGQDTTNNYIIIPNLPVGTYEFRMIVRNNLGQETVSQIFRVQVQAAGDTLGEWSPWGVFEMASGRFIPDQCTRPCGGGKQFRGRQCMGTEAFCRSQQLEEEQDCNTQPCTNSTSGDSLGEWGPWGVVEMATGRFIEGECTRPCDGGVQFRGRPCTGSQSFCMGQQLEEVRDCNTQPCGPGNGTNTGGDSLGEWTPWGVVERTSGRFIEGECTRPCDGGVQFRGRQCRGSQSFCMSQQLEEVRDCNTQPCGPGNGTNTGGDSLGEWTPWGVVEMASGRFIEGECTRPCDGGVQFRGRQCTGSQSFCMSQQLEEVRDCNTQPCGPGNGTNTGGDSLGEWTPWGVVERTSGRFIEGECTRPCDGGVQFRGRQCRGSQSFCMSQQLEEVRDCNTQPCGPGNGTNTGGDNLGEWTPWGVVEMASGRFIEGECTRPCDGGVQFRGRQCTGSQSFCTSQQLEEVRDCNTQPCGPGNGTSTGGDSLGEWTPWGVMEMASGRFIEGECTRPCDGGVQFRGRQCTGSQSFCMSQQLEEVRDCNTQPCGPGNGTNTGGDSLGEWTPWGVVERTSGRFIEGECTRPCDGGVQFRGRQCTGSQSFCMSQQLEEVRDCNTQPCGPGNGTNTGGDSLGEWTPWGVMEMASGRFIEGECTRPCDGGVQFRGRQCRGSQSFCMSQQLEEVRDCNTQPCGPGNGTNTGGDNLSEWTPWGVVERTSGRFIEGECTRPCDGGVQFRGRQCTGSQSFCMSQQLEEVRDCNTQPCGPGNGTNTGGDSLGEWTPWGVVEMASGRFIEGECTRPCDGGVQFRGRQCRGSQSFCMSQQLEEVRDCNTQPCGPGNGTNTGGDSLGEWTPWGVVEMSSGRFIEGECTRPCDGGVQFRGRQCRGSQSFCMSQQLEEVRDCNTQPCGSSSGTAGVTGPTGAGPLPTTNTGAAGGSGTSSPSIPGLGEWGPWGMVDTSTGQFVEDMCSRPCDGGLQLRSRRCDQGNCQGVELEEIRDCNTQPCSGSIGATGPVGQAGGSGTGSTGGDNFQLGEWSPWGVVELATGNFIPGQCTRTCGGGAQFRGRQCTGAGCNTVDPRQLEESRECNTEPCQGTGGSTGPSGGAGGSTGPTGGDVTLGQWGEWGVVELATNNFIPNQCTTPCGGGIQFRRRECTGAPLACQAQQVEEVRTCNQQPCTDGSGTGGGAGGNYEWGPWGPWGVVELSSGEFIVGECTLPCGGGFQFRTRNCSRGECPPPFPPDASQSQRCNEDPCEGGQGGPAPGPLPGPQVPPQISGFSQWTDWSPCPVQCGGGNHTRSRTCASGDPSTCQGDLVQGKPCNTIKCNSIVSANMVDAHIALNGQDSGFSFFCWINQEFSNQCTFNSPGGTANAYYMDGNDDKSEVYIREDFTKNDFTLSIWARPVQVDDRILLAYWDWQFAWRQKFLFGIKDSQVEMKVRNEMEEDLYDLRGGQVRAGMWNHIVVTYQKATNTMNIYLNGVRVGSQTITDPVKNKEIMPMYMDRFAPDVFQLGWMPNPQNERAYNGHMKDLLVLNRSLSDNEVRALFQENLW